MFLPRSSYLLYFFSLHTLFPEVKESNSIILVYDNCRTVLEIIINTFCGQDKLQELVSVENKKSDVINVSRYLYTSLSFGK